MKTRYIVLSTCLIGMSLVSQHVFAEDTDTTKTGSANVELTAGTDEIIPTPPSEPSTGPYDKVGALGITSATNLYFDPIALNTDPATREALFLTKDQTPISNVPNTNGQLETLDPSNMYVPGYSVTDRRGTGAGWTLTTSLGEFKDESQTKTLKGATLSFASVTPITSKTAGNPSAPTVSTPTLTAGGASSILMEAKKDTGLGIWEAQYPSRTLDGVITQKAPITLYVPGDNYAGTYLATLTWNLNDAPTTDSAQ